jgi:lysophospholipase L1-like esterase
MNKYLFTFAVILACSMGAAAQTKRIIAVIGSSTAAGTGAIPISDSWVNLTQAYYQSLGLIDTIYNIALGGSVTFAGLPSWDTLSGAAPDTAHNITKALSYHPDVVLIAYASNDVVADFTVQQTMANLRVIYQEVINAGKIAYVTTTQPRGAIPTAQKEILRTERDSVLAEFPAFSLNFYNPLVAADSLSLNPTLAYDSTHPNNAGHQLLFQVVKNTDILSAFPLALSTDHFTATMEPQDVLLQWTAEEAGAVLFDIQRSQDGISWADLGQENEALNLSGTQYSWKDADPLPGTSYYRLKTSVAGNVSFSAVAAVLRPVPDFAIANVYMPQGGSMLVVDIQSAVNRTLSMSVVDVNGAVVSRQVVSAATPSCTIDLSLSGLARGMYFLRVSTSEGGVVTRRFLKL